MSLLAMNILYKNHVLAKQNRSSRQSRSVATSNQHMHFLSLLILLRAKKQGRFGDPRPSSNFHRYGSGTIVSSCQD